MAAGSASAEARSSAEAPATGAGGETAAATTSPDAAAVSASTLTRSPVATLNEAARNPDGTYDGAKALAWLSQALAGDRGLTEAEIREAFVAIVLEQARTPGPALNSGPVLRITSKVEGFRRAGMSHPKAATDHPIERFAPEEMRALLAEPNLSLLVVLPDGTEVAPPAGEQLDRWLAGLGR